MSYQFKKFTNLRMLSSWLTGIVSATVTEAAAAAVEAVYDSSWSKAAWSLTRCVWFSERWRSLISLFHYKNPSRCKVLWAGLELYRGLWEEYFHINFCIKMILFVFIMIFQRCWFSRSDSGKHDTNLFLLTQLCARKKLRSCIVGLVEVLTYD
jgi:hypothetical protein